MSDSSAGSTTGVNEPKRPQPLNLRQRRILGVLMEKARTTPDTYPLSLNGLVTGCNQKSNRHPLMDLTSEQVEDELEKMRAAGIVAEVQGGSRVAKYRHYGYDFLGVKGAEAAVMTELLLRGEQTAGDLRTRASRFEPISDLAALQGILNSLMEKDLVVALTPSGRGQLLTHNLYLPEELTRLKQLATTGDRNAPQPQPNSAAPQPVRQSTVGATGSSLQTATQTGASREDVEALREEVSELRQLLERLSDRLDRLES